MSEAIIIQLAALLLDFQSSYPLLFGVACAVVFLRVFYALYVFTMGVYRAKLQGRLGGAAAALLYEYVLIAAIADVVCQFTLATIIFLEFPHTRWQRTTVTIWRWSFDVNYLYIEPLVTDRLQRHHAAGDGWRYTLAAYVCDQLLDPFDPEGDHC
jgi:hypothetical protein